MYQFKAKLLYNEKFCTLAELLNFIITLPFAKLSIFDSTLVSHSKLVWYSFLRWYSSRYSVTKKFWQAPSSEKHILPNKKLHPFSDICPTFLLDQWIISFHPLHLFFFYVTFLFKFFSYHQNLSFLRHHQYQL